MESTPNVYRVTVDFCPAFGYTFIMGHLQLKDGDTIAILGGGPAGSFFAMHMAGLCKKHGISLQVVILERKTFLTHGPVGCNMCAGVLGGNIVNMISGLDIIMDSKVIRQNVEGFRLNINGMDAHIHRPSSRVYTVFRGMGPRREPSSEGYTGFDSFMLSQAQKTGASVLHGTVTEIVIPDDPVHGACVVRYTDEKNQPQELTAALVVGAFGVNSTLSRKFGFGYAEPHYWHTCQTELMAPPESDFTRSINIFSRRHSRFLFTAFIPKGRYLTVSGIGRHVKFAELMDELKVLGLDRTLGAVQGQDLRQLCHCHPRLPVTAAHLPYHTRVVMIGDASVSRYMKNGIESAFITSRCAAETALLKGIDEAAFREDYDRNCITTFARDNRYGKAIFFLHKITASDRHLGKGVISLIREESEIPVEKQWISNITWHMFVGDKPYRAILRSLLTVTGGLRLLMRSFGRGKGKL